MTNISKQEKLKLDQIMRVLFKLSKKLTIQLINRLFDEDFAHDKVKIFYGNSEFIGDHFERIVGDLFITIQSNNQLYRYHIEFQTLNDSSMAIRMFRYGFESALEQASSENDSETIEFPKQMVIFLEENNRINSILSINIRLPDGQIVEYIVPVVQYWKYTPEQLQKEKLYALLPLQVFKFRKKLMTLYKSPKLETEKRRLITIEFDKLKETIRQTLIILDELYEGKEIYFGDLERILRVMTNITEYLYDQYHDYPPIHEEVYEMVKTLIDPHIKQEGIKEGIRDSVLEILEEHGSLSVSLRNKIAKEQNIDQLKRWVKLASRSTSIEQFEKHIKHDV